MQDNFWLSFAAIASTLSGFTLASYSIYTNRAEIVASDPMCRNYALKEATSRESLKFIFLTLAMFLVPLLVSFGFLVTGNALDLILLLAYVFISAVLPSGLLASCSTVRYQFRVASCGPLVLHPAPGILEPLPIDSSHILGRCAVGACHLA
jgi:hypothetical protein